MTQLTQGDTARLGNTRSRCWCLTINNYTKRDEEGIAKEPNCKWVYQIEKGDTGNTEHIQAWLSYNSAIRFRTIKDRFPTAHIEKRKGTKKQCLDYHTKIETRVRGPYSNYLDLPEDLYDDGIASDWQKEIVGLVGTKPDNRTIHWYWSDEGNIGKTILAKHLCIQYGAMVIGGKSR